MSSETVRAHIVISKELVEEVDRLVGPRRRSEFIAEAVAEKLAHERLLQAALKVGGSLANVDIPGWETPESTIEWVRALRKENDKHLREDRDE
jgi:predicted transcriptional regulator